jgi:hypothetical protein
MASHWHCGALRPGHYYTPQELEDFIKEHNEKYNTSCATYKEGAEGAEKRTATTAEVTDSAPLQLCPLEKTKEEVLPKSFLVTHPSTDFELIISEAGDEIYLHALKDGSINDEIDLAMITGTYKKDNPATALMKNTSQWFEFKIESPETLILAQAFNGDGSTRPMPSTPVLQPAVPRGPLKVGSYFTHLTEQLKKVRTDMTAHEVNMVDSKWVITNTSPCVLQVAVDINRRKTRDFTWENVGGVLDLAKFRDIGTPKGPTVCKVQILNMVVFWDKVNRSVVDYPRLRVVGNHGFKAGFLYMLMGAYPAPPPTV